MKAEHSITALCQALEVSASGYYDWEQRKSSPTPRATEEQKLQAEIARIHDQSRQTYGAPRVQMHLRSQGQRHGRNRIARLMREQGLCGRHKKRYRVVTTDSKHDEPIAPNRLAEAPVASQPNQLWVADITYVGSAVSWVRQRLSITVASDSAPGPCVVTASCRARRASPAGSMTCPVPSVKKDLPRGIRSAATGHPKGQMRRRLSGGSP